VDEIDDMDEIDELAERDPLLAAYEQVFSRAFASRDAAAVLRAAREDGSLPKELRDALARIDEHGVRLSNLIVTRVRFERLLQGSARAVRWFEDDPRTFAAAFKRYQDEVAPTAAFPPDEARAFETWVREGWLDPGR
jgi:hypothetical protein